MTTSKYPRWTTMLTTGMCAALVAIAPVQAQTPTPTAATPPKAAPNAPANVTAPTPTPQGTGSVTGGTTTTTTTSTALHFTWTWEPEAPAAPPTPNQDLPETEIPTWQLLLNRTADGATSQETVALQASTCQAQAGRAVGTSPAGGTTGSATQAQAYCAEVACPGPGAYVALLQAVNEAGASEPSNVRSFGLGPACEVISYDAALAQALSLDRDAPPTPPGGPVAGGTPPSPGTTPTPEPPTTPGTTPPTAGGPQLGEPTSGPPVADNGPAPNPDGSPTRPNPPDPLDPPTGVNGTIAERDAENLKTYDAAQETARKTYQDLLAKYETLRKQPGAKPADVQKVYEEVVKGYGTATQGLMESYRTALTEYTDLFVAWTEEKAEDTKPGDTPTSADATTPAGHGGRGGNPRCHTAWGHRGEGGPSGESANRHHGRGPDSKAD